MVNVIWPAPNMPDYEQARAAFSWAAARAGLAGLPGGGLNIAYEAVDRHADGPLADAVALRFLSKRQRGDGSSPTPSLKRQTDRFANVLRALGVGRGERVFVLAGRIPELYVAALGTLKHGSVFCPLFSAFGPEPIEQRLRLGDARVLVTTTGALPAQGGRAARRGCPASRTCCWSASRGEIAEIPDVDDFRALMERRAETRYEIAADRRREDMALLHFTSGTTGTPKGAVHVHEAVVAHHATGRTGARPASRRRLLVHGRPGLGDRHLVRHHRAADARRHQHRRRGRASRSSAGTGSSRTSASTVWYTAPTALRMLMRAGAEVAHEYDLSSLRFVASVGEPLNPEVVVWGEEAFGLPVHDNWWQTETGGIMIANYRSMDIRPGSMGRPLPGIEAAIGRRDEEDNPVLAADGTLELVEDPGEQGELVLRPGLAVDVPRLPRRGGALPQVLRRRLVPDRRPRAPRSPTATSGSSGAATT